ncbi:MAG TPA: D-2-hydroxyacid dehydrogenase family protein [Burkholderiales bacterium]|nr:D-2-hydroxyacid dehydrogenase family protein [Burkholderiales bacterium]
MAARLRIAVLDDWQAVAKQSADWSGLQKRADVVFFEEPFAGPDPLANALVDFDIIIAMRERTKFSKELLDRLPKLRMIALTGGRTWTMDFDTLNARGIPVCHTGGEKSGAATAEIALGLLLSAARFMNRGDAAIRKGGFQGGVPAGDVLDGKTLGILGLGKIGSRMARYGKALGMQVIAWSANLTAEKAETAGARLVDKTTMLTQSDAISLHLVLSDRTRGILGAQDLALMKPGAILVNTSRGPLVDEAALVERLKTGKLVAGLDVFAQEPLPADHPLRSLPNTVLTPHLGYGAREVYAQFYRESIENVLAFLAGKPTRVLNPEALGQGR